MARRVPLTSPMMSMATRPGWRMRPGGSSEPTIDTRARPVDSHYKAEPGAGGPDRRARMMYRNHVDGEWVEAEGGRTYPKLDPATGETVGEFPLSSEADVDRAAAR